MLPFEVAALGISVVQRRLAEESQATQETDNGAAIPFWAVIAIIVFVIALFLGGCTCFVVRCFAPDGTQGPAWEANSHDTARDKPIGVGDSNALVVHSHAERSYLGAIPVHNPNDPVMHRRPANYEHTNANYAERQLVLDPLNGRTLPSGNGV